MPPLAAGKGREKGTCDPRIREPRPCPLQSPGRFNQIFSIGPGAPELSRSPGLTRQAPDPGVLPGAGPSAPPRWAAFGGPRSSPRARPRCRRWGLRLAERRVARAGPAPAGPGIVTPRGPARRRHLILEDLSWGCGRAVGGAAASGLRGRAAAATARAGPAGAEADVPPRGAAARGPGAQDAGLAGRLRAAVGAARPRCGRAPAGRPRAPPPAP